MLRNLTLRGIKSSFRSGGKAGRRTELLSRRHRKWKRLLNKCDVSESNSKNNVSEPR